MEKLEQRQCPGSMSLVGADSDTNFDSANEFCNILRKVYNSSPANVTADMGDVSQQGQGILYVQLA